ncbi:hypothetical protein AYI69_g6460 [Smittium culicis]|uniref:Replication factor-A protein 1 N-terminal domain-containing protein n=1 Tax=Smittium culicis TaxID=133412 RepID=A0A1R1XYR7_9FUNG|nr:hypothetical protein AYI69_g10020 [Smittium culicis]OMJ19832.1 hypothetical protein AYI69_g6460 [Smittium culicis]
MTHNLSEGAIKAFETGQSESFQIPVLQVISQLKEIVPAATSANKMTRFRAIVSDGVSSINGMFYHFGIL